MDYTNTANGCQWPIVNWFDYIVHLSRPLSFVIQQIYSPLSLTFLYGYNKWNGFFSNTAWYIFSQKALYISLLIPLFCNCLTLQLVHVLFSMSSNTFIVLNTSHIANWEFSFNCILVYFIFYQFILIKHAILTSRIKVKV